MMERNVLDHGFVRLVDTMGDDRAIVNAARVSIAGQEVSPTQDDHSFIRMLMAEGHTGPFEHVELKFHIKAPIFVARQWLRHRTASVNEMSARYGVVPAEAYTPPSERMKKQDTKNKQQSATDAIAEPWSSCDAIFASNEQQFSLYADLLERGLVREVARVVLPLSTYTEWYWKIDLHNLFHFLQKRMDRRSAQSEIADYADAVAELIEPIVPIAWEAFVDFRLNAVALSVDEMDALKQFIRTQRLTHDFKTKRESRAWAKKLARLIA